MNTNHLALLVAPLLLAALGTPSGQDDTQERAWVLLDGVAAQAGGDIVTMRDLDRAVRDAVRARFGDEPLSSKEALDAISWERLQELVFAYLESQAGADMGIDPDQVAQLIERYVSQQRKELGAAEYVDELQAGGRRALSVQEDEARRLYRQIWRWSKVGRRGLAGTRPTRDRFIRPGELKGIYRTNRAQLRPDQVRLRVLVVSVAASGGVEQARERLAEARRRLADGEDFGDLVMEMGDDARDTGGLLGWARVEGLTHPALQVFAGEADLDELSPILPVPPVGEPQAFVLARLEDRREEGPPSFEDREVQLFLRDIFTRQRENRILEYERSNLGRGAFSWVHPGLRALQAGAAAQGPVR